jgi:hypothetical protein
VTEPRPLAAIRWRDVTLRSAQPMLDDREIELEDVIQVGDVDVLDALAYAEASGAAPDAAVLQLTDRFAFALVRIPVNIRPGDGLSVRFLGVECPLDTAATCWSLAPELVEEALRAKSTATVSAQLHVFTAEAGGEREHVVYQPSIVAFGVGRPDPAWELRPVAGRPLRGIQLLHLVARTPRGAIANGTVRIRADVVKERRLINTVAIGRDESRDVQHFTLGG